ncbi:MAG: CehA/McbA family metallohydrolase [Armatimonadetes bacterium]|nr:CehA/McbA family metallohydrolase [Armatimonadota bacterium]MDW8027113.1 CehA/McbA family metallohydrolase [Armatimonadota bacterium]
MRRLGLLIVTVVTIAFASLGVAQVKAFVARSLEDLPPSKRIGGRIGDIVMRNEKIAVVITAFDHVHRGAASGGNIVDVSLAGAKVHGADELDQIFLFLNRYPRQGRYSSVQIVRDGSDGVAEVLAEGVDSEDGSLKLRTVYRLEAGKPYLIIRTAVTNTGEKPLTKFELGDAIQWGNSRPFAPLFGFAIQRRTETLDWIGGEGYGIAYAWFTNSGQNKTINGLGWSDPIVLAAEIKPNETVLYERYFAAAPSIAEVAKIAWELQGKRLHQVKGIVRSKATGKPVSGIKVVAEVKGQGTEKKEQEKDKGQQKFRGANQTETKFEPLIAATQTDSKGNFAFWLPSGEYLLQAKHIARLSLKSASIQLPKNLNQPVELLVSGAGVLLFEIRDEMTKELIPARLTFLGTNGTTTPDFGPNFIASGAENYVFTATGKGTRTIPPGTYRVYASRGLEYDAEAKEVSIPEQKPVKVTFTLKRSVDTKGWISADFHMHCSNSHDSAVSPEDRITSCVAEGLEFVAITDHDFVTDPMPSIHKLGLERWIKGAAGVEITTRGMGHYNTFPLIPDPTKPGNGTIIWQGKTPAQIFSEIRSLPNRPLIIVNHPRFSTIAYFTPYGFDPETCTATKPGFSLDFDAMELCNGKAQTDLDILLRDWFGLLNFGYKIAATAGSDSHTLTHDEVGHARNFIFVGTDDPKEVTTEMVVQAVRECKVVVSLGPFVTFTADGNPISSLVSKPKGDINIEIQVQAPNWVSVTEVELIANGIALKRWKVEDTKGKPFSWRASAKVRPKRDAWYVVIVRGAKGSLEPILRPFRTFEGETFKVVPFSITNPIWVDRDGNGIFDPPRKRVLP